jgi:hypothetical protein
MERDQSGFTTVFPYLLSGMLLFASFAGCKKDDSQKASLPPQIIYHTFTVSTQTLTNDTVFYDVDDDGVDDITVTKTIDTVGPGIQYSGKIYSLNPEFRFAYMNMASHNQMVDSGQIVNNSTDFSWIDSPVYGGGISFTPGSNNWANGVFWHYFAYCRNKPGTYNLGWFHFNYMVIDELGYNKTPNQSIVVGQKN